MSECKIGPSSASYIYTELWDHNETNQQVASYLQGARDKSANKPQIVAAYAGDFYQGGDAVTFTIDAGQGGTVTLVTRYARQDDDPAYHQMILDMGQPTQKLIKYVHFDATGSYDTWKEMTETVELTPGVHTISFWVPGDQTYTPVNIDCITSREFNSDSIKLADAAFAANGAHHLEEGEAVPASVFAVSPDDDGGRPTPLDFTTGTDEQGRTTITFNVGRLSSWGMVVFSPTVNAAGSDAATTTSEAVRSERPPQRWSARGWTERSRTAQLSCGCVCPA